MSKSKNKHEYEIECKHYKTLYKKKSEQLFYMRRRLLKHDAINKRGAKTMTQTILATGNRGFIGQNVFFTLCENSTYKVIGYDRKEGYELCDKKQLQKIFAEFKPSVVVHLASNVSMEQDKCVEDVQALVNLLQMCEQHKVKKLIFTSSAAVYGNHYPEIIPVNSYGLSKLQCEQWCKFYVQRGMDITILRLANIYGSRGNGVINKFIENIKNQKPIIMYGDGHQKRDSC